MAKKQSARRTQSKRAPRRSGVSNQKPAGLQKAIEVQLTVCRPGVIEVLRPNLHIGRFMQYLEGLVLAEDDGRALIVYPEIWTELMEEHWEELDETHFEVFVCGSVIVRGSMNGRLGSMKTWRRKGYFPEETGKTYVTREWTRQERQALLDAVGQPVQARLKFRENGDSPALREGADFKWIRPCLLAIKRAKLVKDPDLPA